MIKRYVSSHVVHTFILLELNEAHVRARTGKMFQASTGYPKVRISALSTIPQYALLLFMRTLRLFCSVESNAHLGCLCLCQCCVRAAGLSCTCHLAEFH